MRLSLIYIQVAILFTVAIFLNPLSVHAKLFWKEEDAVKDLSLIVANIEKTGDTEKNIKALDNFTKSYSKAKVTEEAIFLLTDIYTKKKQFTNCSKAYKRYFKRFKKSRHKSQALYGLGYCQYRNGYLEQASQNISYAMAGKYASVETKVKSQLLLETINSVLSTKEEGNRITIGAALPLDGKFSLFGEKALRGVLLASGVFKNKLNEDPTSVIVETRSTTKKGTKPSQAILELAKNKNIAGIIGPLTKKNANEVAGASQRKGLPTIALTQKENITDKGTYIFRNFMTPAQQARTLAAFVEKTYYHPRALILYPQTGYGRELASLFKQEIINRGGEIVGELHYESGKKDFAEELRTLFKIESEEKKIGRRYVTEYETNVKADVLFIPDYYSTVAQIIPHIAYYKIKDIQLLGSNGWNSKKLIKLAGKYMDDVVFVDGFSLTSTQIGTVNFIEDFKDTFGYTPGIIEAESYDATMMLLESISASTSDGSNIRDQIRTNLENINYEKGATGNITFDENREPEKDLFLLTVKKKKVIEINQEEIEVKRTIDQYLELIDIEEKEAKEKALEKVNKEK